MVPAGKGTGHDNRRPTMADVARRAGVSEAAVSYVFNDRPGVGAQRRRRILEAAEELGFRPNRVAKALRAGRTHALGLLVGEIQHPAYWEFATGAIKRAEAHGYSVFITVAGDDGRIPEAQVQALEEHQVDGLIFTTAVEADRPMLELLIRRRVPIVLFSRRLAGLEVDFVGVDEIAGGRRQVDHLVRLGHRRIGILSGPSRSSAVAERVAGNRAALRSAGLELPPAWYAEGALTPEQGYEMGQKVLGQGGPRPTALVCSSDPIALGAIDAAWDLGLRVPEDVAIVGFDDVTPGASRPIQLTTVRAPRAEMGALAMNLLLERVQDDRLDAREVILPSELVVRRTCGAPLASPLSQA